MVKVIFFDVDGTLISHVQKNISESTKKALNILYEKGIKRVIATGRHMNELSLLPVSNIDFDAYITLNGQLCLNANGDIILENPIIGEDKERIIELFKEKTIPIMLVEKNRMYINFINQHVEQAQQAISTSVPEIDVYTGNEIYQAIAYVENGNEKVIAKYLSNCKITRWNDYAVDIITNSGGKVLGVQEYLKINNIVRKETMAFGDGENDIEMLRYVHTGIAMGNADEITKENADYITQNVDNNGIMKALLTLKIIKSEDLASSDWSR